MCAEMQLAAQQAEERAQAAAEEEYAEPSRQQEGDIAAGVHTASSL